MDNIVDTLKIEVTGDSSKAVSGLDKLISTLGRIEDSVGNGSKALNKITKSIERLSNTLGNIEGSNLSKFRDLSKGIKSLSGLNEIRLPKKLAEQIVNIGAAADCLKSVDFSKLTEMANGLTALEGLSNVKVPRLNNISSSPMTSPAETSSSPVETSSLSDSSVLTAQVVNHLEDIGKVAQSSGQNLTDAFLKSNDSTDLLNMKLTDLKVKLQDALQPDSGASQSEIANIGLQIKSLENKIGGSKGKFTNFFKSITSSAKNSVNALVNAFKVLSEPLKNVINKATSKVGEFFTMFKKRALYRAINGIISAITTGFKEGTGNVYQYSKTLGGTLSSSLNSISTSFLYFKNSIGAAVAPLINMLAPAIEYIIDKCVALLNILNQVFAKLSGASTWTKAVKAPTEYAKAANGARSANEKLKKSILGIDEINPLSDNSSGGGGGGGGGNMDYSSMFEETELGDINNPFEDFFAPFKAAWENEGQNTINAIKNAFVNIKSLLVSVGKSFKEVWTNGTGQQTVETILRIVQNIVICVGNLASSFQKAWDNAGTGTQIVQGLWDIFNDILSFIEGFCGLTADWIGNLDFSPLLTSVSGVIAAFEPLVNLIGDTLLWAYETVLQPIAKWVIEEAAPASINAVTAALEMLHAFLKPFLAGFRQLWASLQPIIAWVESVVIVIINGLRSVFEKCAKVFQEKGKKIQEIVSGIGEIVSVVWSIVEPIFNLLKDIVGNVFSFVGDIVGSVVGFVIDLLHGLIEFIVGVFTGDWDRAWNGIEEIFVGVWDLIKGVAIAIWDFLNGIWDSIKSDLLPVWEEIESFFSQIWDSIKDIVIGAWNKICEIWGTVTDWFKDTVITPISNFFSKLWKNISTAASNAWESITTFFAPAVEWFSQLFGSVFKTISDIFYNIGVIANGCWEIIKSVWGLVSAWFDENIIQPVSEFFSNLWDGIKECATNAWEGIKTVFSTISGWIDEKIIQPVSKFFTELWNGFVEKAASAWEGVKTVFDKVATFFHDTFQKAWQGIVDVFSLGGEIFVEIKDGVVSAFKTVVNGLIDGINSVVAVPFNAINGVLNWLRNISIAGLTPFSGIRTISVPQIPKLANGGVVNEGQIFIAREAGPELVANVGRQTAVMNNDQIVESVSQGVADANTEQNALLREEISILRKLLEKDTNVTAYVGTGDLISGFERKNRRDGKTVVPIGV